MSCNNREYLVTKGYLKRVVNTAEKLNKTQEQQRMSLSIMESLFKHSASTTAKLIEFGVSGCLWRAYDSLIGMLLPLRCLTTFYLHAKGQLIRQLHCVTPR